MGDGKMRQAGPLNEVNNQNQGKSGGGTPKRVRRLNANAIQSGGINRGIKPHKGKGMTV